MNSFQQDTVGPLDHRRRCNRLAVNSLIIDDDILSGRHRLNPNDGWQSDVLLAAGYSLSVYTRPCLLLTVVDAHYMVLHAPSSLLENYSATEYDISYGIRQCAATHAKRRNIGLFESGEKVKHKKFYVGLRYIYEARTATQIIIQARRRLMTSPHPYYKSRVKIVGLNFYYPRQ